MAVEIGLARSPREFSRKCSCFDKCDHNVRIHSFQNSNCKLISIPFIPHKQGLRLKYQGYILECKCLKQGGFLIFFVIIPAKQLESISGCLGCICSACQLGDLGKLVPLEIQVPDLKNGLNIVIDYFN